MQVLIMSCYFLCTSSHLPIIVPVQYGYGQWMAIKFAIRRNPTFRFNYFLRSLPIDQLGRRCEQLMKAAEKEVEQLEKAAREAAGIVCEPDQDVKTLPVIDIPPFRVLQKQRHEAQRSKAEKERRELENKIAEIESQIRDAQGRLKALNDDTYAANDHATPNEKNISHNKAGPSGSKNLSKRSGRKNDTTSNDGAVGPNGDFVAFPPYDGTVPPAEWKKPFTQYCNHTKKDLKESLPPDQRKNKVSLTYCGVTLNGIDFFISDGTFIDMLNSTKSRNY